MPGVNVTNTAKVVVETLGAWFQNVLADAPYSLEIRRVSFEWSEPGQPRVYPEVEIDQVDQDVEEWPPFQIQDASNVTNGSVAMCFGSHASKLAVNIWCQSANIRQNFEAAMQAAFNASMKKSGIYLTPPDYWGTVISYTIEGGGAQKRNDVADDIKKGVYRLTYVLETETQIVNEIAGPPTVIDPRFIVSVDPEDQSLAAWTPSVNPAIPAETLPVIGEPIPAPFSEAYRSLHQVDEFTLALWQLGDSNPHSAVDQTGRFYMPPSGGAQTIYTQGLVQVAPATQFNTATDQLRTNTEQNWPATTDLLGEWTVEAWVMLQGTWPPSAGEIATIVFLGFSGNVLLALGVGTDRKMTMQWEYGSAPTLVTASDSTVLALNTRYHLAARKRAIPNTTQFAVDFFVNGVQTSTTNGLHNADGGATDDWGIGGNFTGILQSIRVESVALSNASILKDYSQGA